MIKLILEGAFLHELARGAERLPLEIVFGKA
jgi:hypothetical protein